MAAIADVLGLLQPAQSIELNTNRVLVCAPSHAACDVITRRLRVFLKRTEIFRMYDSARPSNTVPGDIVPFTCQLPKSDRFTLPIPEGKSSVSSICIVSDLPPFTLSIES